MPVQTTMTVMDGYIQARTTGTIESAQEAIAYTTIHVDKARQTGIRRLLLDERDVTFRVDFADSMEVAEYWNSKGLPALGLRLAVLPSHTTPVQMEEFETLAANRSVAYRVFADEESALDWLLDR